MQCERTRETITATTITRPREFGDVWAQMSTRPESSRWRANGTTAFGSSNPAGSMVIQRAADQMLARAELRRSLHDRYGLTQGEYTASFHGIGYEATTSYPIAVGIHVVVRGVEFTAHDIKRGWEYVLVAPWMPIGRTRVTNRRRLDAAIEHHGRRGPHSPLTR